MWQDAHDSYLESTVLSADPIELIRLMYRSATRAVENARRHLAAGDVLARARSISHASAVLIELATALDHQRGGEISANLAQLYDYMLRKLNEANLQQTDPPLAEVLGLLATLSEGWDGIKGAAVEDVPAPAKPAESDARSWTQLSSPEPSGYESSWTSYGSSREQPESQAPQPYADIPKVETRFPIPSSPAESFEPIASEPASPGPWPPAPGPWESPVPGPSLWAQETPASYSSRDWSL